MGNTILFFAGATFLTAVLAWLACLIWGTIKFFWATLICSCLALLALLLPQVWSIELLWWVKVMVMFFTVVGIVAVALIIEAIAHEHCSSWKPTQLQHADRTVDITRPMQNGGD